MFPGAQGGPLQPPGSDQGAASPGPGGGNPSPAPAVADPNEAGMRLVTDLVTSARRLGMKYPAMMSEVREITQNLAPKMIQKLVQSQPAPEPMAPPV
jgi:hypothetical protein